MIKTFYQRRGVTLIELLIVLAFLVTLFTFAVANIEHFRGDAILSSTVDEIVSLLKSAQSLTLSGKEGMAYKVRFFTSNVQLLDEQEKIVTDLSIDPLVEVLPPGSDIEFFKVSGKSNGGIVTVRLKNLSKVQVITVSELGKITVS